jgi:hypothetical protein
VNRQFESKYDPTIEDRYQKVVDHNNQPCVLEVWTSSFVSHVDFCRFWTQLVKKHFQVRFSFTLHFEFTHISAMRELYMKNGEGFVLVYSVTSQKSLDDLEPIRNGIVRHKGAVDVCYTNLDFLFLVF